MGNRTYIEVGEVLPWPVIPWYARIVMKILYAIIPLANPDFEALYPKVKRWLLEVELPSALPKREVGLDESGEPIVSAPIGKNYGFWVDGPSPVEWKTYPKVDPEEFFRNWNVVKDRLGKMGRPNGSLSSD